MNALVAFASSYKVELLEDGSFLKRVTRNAIRALSDNAQGPQCVEMSSTASDTKKESSNAAPQNSKDARDHQQRQQQEEEQQLLPDLALWLQSQRLDAYVVILRALDIKELAQLVSMAPERIDSLTNLARMKPSEALRFKKSIYKVRQLQ